MQQTKVPAGYSDDGGDRFFSPWLRGQIHTMRCPALFQQLADLRRTKWSKLVNKAKSVLRVLLGSYENR